MIFDELPVSHDVELRTQFETGERPMKRWCVPLGNASVVWFELTWSGKVVMRFPEFVQQSGRLVLPLTGLRVLLEEMAEVSRENR